MTSLPTRLRANGTAPIEVLLADDHTAVRRSLRMLLESEPDVSVVAEADDLFTTLRLLREGRPGVVVLDLQMPNGSTLDMVRRLRSEAPRTAIVVAMMEDGAQFALGALHAGALGYVLKQHADRELAGAVRSAARGERYVSPRVPLPATLSGPAGSHLLAAG